MDSGLTIEHLEVEKEELNFILQELNLNYSKLEELKKDTIYNKEVFNDSLKKISNDIEFIEQQIEDIGLSIDFIKNSEGED